MLCGFVFYCGLIFILCTGNFSQVNTSCLFQSCTIKSVSRKVGTEEAASQSGCVNLFKCCLMFSPDLNLKTKKHKKLEKLSPATAELSYNPALLGATKQSSHYSLLQQVEINCCSLWLIPSPVQHEVDENHWVGVPGSAGSQKTHRGLCIESCLSVSHTDCIFVPQSVDQLNAGGDGPEE